MTKIANSLYTMQPVDGFTWSVCVLCTIIGDDREHGWMGQGATEGEAMMDLQEQMKAAT